MPNNQACLKCSSNEDSGLNPIGMDGMHAHCRQIQMQELHNMGVGKINHGKPNSIR